MNQYSNIMVKKNLAFPWKSLRTDLSSDSQTLKQIDNDKNPTAQVGDIVSVKAKLISKSDVEPVFSYTLNKTFNKSETIIADSTSAMRLTLWGEAIDKVEIYKLYQFSFPRQWCSNCSIEAQGERSSRNHRTHPVHQYQQTTCLCKVQTSQRLWWRHPWWPYTVFLLQNKHA